MLANKIEKLNKLIDSMSKTELTELSNACLEAENYDCDIVYSMDEFDDFFAGFKPSEIVKNVDSEFNLAEPYFYINGHGFAVSCDAHSLPVDKKFIVNHILEHDEDCGSDKIRKILDE